MCPKAILITGTPGTGKTKLAHSLASGGLGIYVDLKKMIKDKGLAVGFDQKRNCDIVDENRLVELLESMISHSKKILIIESHIAHYVPPEFAQICLVLRCNPKELRKRLKARKYSKAKIDENVEAEKLDVILIEALGRKHRVCEIDTTGLKIDELSKKAEKVIKGKIKCSYGKINWNV